MKDQIRDYIKKYDNVTFVELAKEVEGFTGDMHFVNRALDNVILWDGISQDGINALIDLLKNEEIFISECAPTVYWYHGFMGFSALETIEVAKSMKTPSWLPVVFLREPPAQR